MPRTPPPYPPAFRAEAVRLARGGATSLPAPATDRGVASAALRRWLRQDAAAAGRGQPGAPTSDERAAPRRLRRAVNVRRHERASLRKAAASCAQEARWAGGGSATRRGRTLRARCCAACRGSPARPLPRGRAAGSRRAPPRMRRCGTDGADRRRPRASPSDRRGAAGPRRVARRRGAPRAQARRPAAARGGARRRPPAAARPHHRHGAAAWARTAPDGTRLRRPGRRPPLVGGQHR